jgi:hypothetical protein
MNTIANSLSIKYLLVVIIAVNIGFLIFHAILCLKIPDFRRFIISFISTFTMFSLFVSAMVFPSPIIGSFKFFASGNIDESGSVANGMASLSGTAPQNDSQTALCGVLAIVAYFVGCFCTIPYYMKYSLIEQGLNPKTLKPIILATKSQK